MPKKMLWSLLLALYPKFNLLAIFLISYYIIYFIKETVQSLYWVKVHLKFVDVKCLQTKIASRKYRSYDFRMTTEAMTMKSKSRF